MEESSQRGFDQCLPLLWAKDLWLQSAVFELLTSVTFNFKGEHELYCL